MNLAAVGPPHLPVNPIPILRLLGKNADLSGIGRIDDPTVDFGWVLIGTEEPGAAKRFDSREIDDASLRPILEITYTAGLWNCSNRVAEALHLVVEPPGRAHAAVSLGEDAAVPDRVVRVSDPGHERRQDL